MKVQHEERAHIENVMALQLSGKIPALGAGGPGSIPGEALFIIRVDDVSYKFLNNKDE